jgi:glycosyltransferase involved in cell wall biosynthesis
MITRDEEQFLAGCLSSVRGMVDEIIVVDTGSVDRTIDIAGLFGARIYDFEWTDDFSAARNFSLSKASEDWIFSLDADEIISERDHIRLRSLTGAAAAGCTAYSIVTRNYTNDPNQVGWVANDGQYRGEEAGCGWIPTEKVRLFPNHRRIRYEYSVHEMVEPSLHREGLEIQGCSIPIHHYGPLAEVNKYQKMQAYYRMGKSKLDQLGDNAVALRELAVQAAILGKTAEAVELWEKFIALKPNMPEAFVHLGTAYFQRNNYRAALQAAKKALKLTPDMKEAIYNYALCEFIIGDIRKSIVYLENLLVQSPGFLPAEFVLAAAHICGGQREKGLKSLRGLSRTEMGPSLAATGRDLAQRLMDENRSDWATSLIESVRNSKKWRNPVRNAGENRFVMD